MDALRVLGLLLVGPYLLRSAHSLSLDDPNTCALEETYLETKNVTVKHTISVKTYVWCMSVPPRCTTYRIEWRSATETQVIPMNRTVVGCCPGYKLSPQDTTCAPICTSDCINGSCIAPENCDSKQSLTPPSDQIATSATSTHRIEADNDLQIENTLLTVTKQNMTDPLSILTTTPHRVTLGNPFPKTSTSPTTPLANTFEEEDVGSRPVLANMDIATVIDETPGDFGRTNPQNNVDNILNATGTIMATTVTSRSSQDHSNVAGNTSNAVRRDPLKYVTSTENQRTDNDTTYSKPQQMNLSDRFVYSIGISVGIMFAIIMVTLVITKHQHYLQEVDPSCGNTRDSKKCKAAHQTEEQETTLHVVRYQVTRETTNQPIAGDCETTCSINSTRNSTITVYNFPPPPAAFDAPLRPPVRPFGDYDFPSPMAENVYDEIPAHRDTGEGYRCFVRQ